MAYAMGYRMSPLTGLRNFRFHPNAFCNELLTQNARRIALSRLFLNRLTKRRQVGEAMLFPQGKQASVISPAGSRGLPSGGLQVGRTRSSDLL